MPPKKQQTLEESFRLVDKDGDGKISLLELSHLIRSLGHFPSERHIADCLKEFGSNNLIDFNGLNKSISKISKNKLKEEDLVTAFAVFDPKRTGFVRVHELRKVLSTLGENLSKEEIEDFIKEADPQNSGGVDYNQFAQVLLGVN